jgi:hypothetical protein
VCIAGVGVEAEGERVGHLQRCNYLYLKFKYACRHFFQERVGLSSTVAVSMLSPTYTFHLSPLRTLRSSMPLPPLASRTHNSSSSSSHAHPLLCKSHPPHPLLPRVCFARACTAWLTLSSPKHSRYVCVCVKACTGMCKAWLTLSSPKHCRCV